MSDQHTSARIGVDNILSTDPDCVQASRLAPSSLFCVLPALGPFWLSDILLVTGACLDARQLAPRCSSTHSAYSSLPDILVVTSPLATLRHPGYSEPFVALLVTRQFPTCPSPLAYRNPQWPSWSLLALLVRLTKYHKGAKQSEVRRVVKRMLSSEVRASSGEDAKWLNRYLS